MKIFSRTGIALGLAMAATAVLTACGGGDDDGIDDRLSISKPTVRVVHAIPAGPNVDVYQNGGRTSILNVPYKFVSKYFDVDSDNDQTFALNVAGTTTELARTTFNGEHGHKYTVVALPGEARADILLIDDPYGKGVFSDKARVRGLNASFNAPNVDIYVTSANANLAQVTPTFANVGYKNAVPASGSDSIDLNGGDYVIRVTAAGTKTEIFNSGPVNIGNNADWLITTIPTDGIGAAVPGNIKVLVAKANDDAQTATELLDQ
jgi:hypothetical protein